MLAQNDVLDSRCDCVQLGNGTIILGIFRITPKIKLLKTSMQ